MKHDYAGDVVATIDAVVAYAKDKALYDVQCRVNLALAEWRKAELTADASIMHGITMKLNLMKQKLKLLEARIADPPELKVALLPLFSEGKARIEELRRLRQRR